MSERVDEIAGQFAIEGRLVSLSPLTSGHINDTHLGAFQSGAGVRRYIHQRINHLVFKQPEKLMENMQRVTRYARDQIVARGGDGERETLNLVPTRSGEWFVRTAEGNYWRTYLYIDGARTYEVSDNPQHIYQAARAFGDFMRLLDGLPGPRLHETIQNFHNTVKRFADYSAACQADRAGRKRDVQREVDALLEREAYAGMAVNALASGSLPERVTHNDTKLNNVLIDDQTGKGLCVLDLDTVMPGSALYDFGDLIRMGAATAAEDEADLSKVTLDLKKFQVLSQGFLEATRDLLTPLELEMLAFGGILITYEQSLRFLGDYLNGDVYYKVHRAGQNLDRARNQIKMLQALEQNRAAMELIIARLR